LGKTLSRISSAFLFPSCLKTVLVSGSESIAARRFALKAAVSMMGRGIESRLLKSEAKRLGEGLGWSIRGGQPERDYVSEIRRLK